MEDVTLVVIICFINVEIDDILRHVYLNEDKACIFEYLFLHNIALCLILSNKQ